MTSDNIGSNGGPPLLVQSRKEEVTCPLGYICDEDGNTASCIQIQEKAKSMYFLGDIHGGAYCPENEVGFLNCPIGSYCPDAATKLPCPKGYFCPHKTRTPELKCSQCDEGSESYPRQIFGFILFAILGAILLSFFAYKYIKKLMLKNEEHRKELESRIIDSTREKELKKKQRAENAKLRSKIEGISKRVGRTDVIHEGPDGITYDVESLFDAIDKDGDLVLSYSELTKALLLKETQSREFASFMNSKGGYPEADSVNKQTFVNHFLDVLTQSSNYDPTPEDAGRLFDEIYQQQETAKNDQIDLNDLINTRLAYFLSMKQIHDLIKMMKQSNESTESLSVRSGGDSNKASTRESERKNKKDLIGREVFISLYPTALYNISQGKSEIPRGVDITFKNLSLHIPIGGKPTPVVNDVTGRLREKSMTALMGGSGAGKTSLLNALCGRAFYGDVTGDIFINGHKATIEEHKDAVGFVPQDDIVYAELTVRENFIYSGKFQLPAGTSTTEIEDLADDCMASLGLTRVADNLVGDVTRRGVSGGEKKRVNIGLELMAKPAILFLDEPTSGLDSSSAMLVMKALRELVDKQGVTVCSVIHQPRKFIFVLFDSLILLGVGGKIVYHGPTDESEAYFNRLNYELPLGESVADWLIDISSGRLKPSKSLMKSRANSILNVPADETSSANTVFEQAKINRNELYRQWNDYFDGLNDKALYKPPEPYQLPLSIVKPNFGRQLLIHIQRNMLVARQNISSKLVDTLIIVGPCIIMALLDGPVELTLDADPNIENEFDVLSSIDPEPLLEALPSIFQFTLLQTSLSEYAMKVAIIVSVLVALSATKVLTEKRLELFRESGSGYDINAYFLAVNITSSLEHGIQLILCALVNLWLRNTTRSIASYIVDFILLGWISVSWALFFPIIVPPKNIVLVTGFFMAFFGMIFGGTVKPIEFKDYYSNLGLELFVGLFSPTRYFIESVTVSEQRSLPAQTGFTTIAGDATAFPMEGNTFNMIGIAQRDMPGVTVQSGSGWYWGALPVFLVGMTVRLAAFLLLHLCNRSKQAKVSLFKEMRGSPKTLVMVMVLFSLFVLFLALAVAAILGKV